MWPLKQDASYNVALLTLWFLPSETDFGRPTSRIVWEDLCVVLSLRYFVTAATEIRDEYAGGRDAQVHWEACSGERIFGLRSE